MTDVSTPTMSTSTVSIRGKAIAAALADPLSVFAARSPGGRAPGALTQTKPSRTKGAQRPVELAEVPGRLPDLVSLPGVGRKTANVVLGNAFGVPGITVDTHVGRLARRLGWSDAEDPVVVESHLAALFPPRDWTPLSHRLIFHGRRTCHARRPACGACPLARWCPSYGEGPTDPVAAAALVKTQGPACGPGRPGRPGARPRCRPPAPSWCWPVAARRPPPRRRSRRCRR